MIELTDHERKLLIVLNVASSDERAATELGMSLRSFRRHVAALLARLQVDSRYQAGVRAAELGVIPQPRDRLPDTSNPMTNP